jgi:hypothetical protein
MDGVLCNFDKAIFEIDGKTSIEDLREGDPELDLWTHIQKGGTIANFYMNLEWHPEGKILWDYLQTLPNVEILTSLGKSNPDKEGARYGKELWLRNHGIDVPLNFSQKAFDKQFWVNSKDDVLIDDYDSNIRQWNQASGIGILFTTAQEAIKKLKEIK